MAQNKAIGIAVGIAIMVGSFLTVFGSSLKNLSPKENSTLTVVVSSPTASTTPTPTPAPIETTPATPATTSTGSTTSASHESTKPVATPVTSPTTTPVTTPAPTEPAYTLATVSQHDSATTCWSAINGYVYDLTTWVNDHPGGRSAILMICGKDGSPLFNMQHGGQRSPASILASFEIGLLQV